MQTDWKLDFTSITKAVVSSVPVDGKEGVVEVFKFKHPARSMLVLAAFIIEQKLKDICPKVDGYVAAPVDTHLQASVYCG